MRDIKPTRVRRDEMCGNKRLHFHAAENQPSWKRYGKGVANFEVTLYSRARNGAGCVGVSLEETAFADGITAKRDVTKAAMMELDRPAALALWNALGDFLAATVPT